MESSKSVQWYETQMNKCIVCHSTIKSAVMWKTRFIEIMTFFLSFSIGIKPTRFKLSPVSCPWYFYSAQRKGNKTFSFNLSLIIKNFINNKQLFVDEQTISSSPRFFFSFKFRSIYLLSTNGRKRCSFMWKFFFPSCSYSNASSMEILPFMSRTISFPLSLRTWKSLINGKLNDKTRNNRSIMIVFNQAKMKKTRCIALLVVIS